MIWTWKGIKALFTRGKHKRTYPARGKEVCVCGRLITRCRNGRFVRHECVTTGELPVSMAELDEIDARR